MTKNGASFGLMNGMGSAGRLYEPGKIHRSDRMASEGIYDDGKKGIRRMTDPELRLKDQDRDGIQAEVLYGILGATSRINDDEAAGEMLRIYNEWLADFCNTHPDRFAGLACIPNHDIDAAVGEIERVARRGGVRGLEISRRRRHDAVMGPVVEPDVGRGRGERTAGAFPHDRQRRAARLLRSSRQRWRSPPAPPASPASRCTCRTYCCR